jgi:hypothetical protein
MFFKGAALALLKITIVVYHSEAVPERDLARAETLAGRIFRQAGVEILWRQATPADTAPPPTEIPLHLVEVQPTNLGPDISGFAILMPEGSYAGVSCPAVRKTAYALEADEATVLGAVISHELGHVLLGSKEHSTSGVMVPRLGRHEIEAAGRGELRFQRPEARGIRVEASRRGRIQR